MTEASLRPVAVGVHRSGWRLALAVSALLVIAVLAGLLYRASSRAPAPAAAPSAPPPVADLATAPAAGPASAPAAPTTVQPPADTAALTTAGIGGALEQLFGREASLRFLQLDEFPRRFVATVDNLGRAHAPALLWPVNPTQGRFTVLQQNGSTVISPDNGLRYSPLVLLLESVDVDRVVNLYARMYPLLQTAYGELGYPQQSFNDRLLQVIDLLLATPEPSKPIQLDLLEIAGPVPSQRPWVHYQFADPALEALAAGQKLLLRMGPVNERRLKGKLRAIRAGIAARSRAR